MGDRPVRWCGVAAMLAVLLWSSSVMAQNDSPPADEVPTVTTLFLQTPIHEALEDIASQTGVPIVADPTLEGMVTLEMNQTPLPVALDMILAQGGYVWRQKNGYILVGSPLPDGPLFLELSETRDIKLQNLKSEDVLASLPVALQPYVSGDARMNRLAITAPPSVMQRIVDTVERLDEPVRHILLEARVVILERDALLDIGVEWDFPTIQAGTFTTSEHDGRWPWSFEVGLTPGFEFTNALLLTLNLLEQNDEAAIVSNPQLMVRDAEAAQMGVNTEEYFLVANEIVGGVASDLDLEKVTAGTNMIILPRITGDNEVTLEMDIEVSNVVGRGPENLPIITRRTAQSVVKLRSGGTAAVAGLSDTRFQELDRRVPGASNLPGLGRLFRNDTNDEASRQLAVFITATIVEDAARGPKRDYRMNGVAVDEATFRERLRAAIQRINAQEEVIQ